MISDLTFLSNMYLHGKKKFLKMVVIAPGKQTEGSLQLDIQSK